MTQLAHLVVGNGDRDVVGIHGFLGMGRNLQTLARRWVERDANLRILLPDLTGHGTSPELPPNPTLTILSQDILTWAHDVGVKPDARWVGHSLGGRVALLAAGMEPELVQDVTLMDISPGPLPGSDTVLDALVDAPEHALERGEFRSFFQARGISSGIIEWLLMNLERSDAGLHWRVDRQALRELRHSGHHEDLWSVVEKRSFKLDVLRGGNSSFVQDADVARFERAGVQVRTVEGAGHFMHVDALEALLALLQR